MGSPLYPDGKTSFWSKWSAGQLKFYKRSTATVFHAIDGTNGALYGDGLSKTARRRFTTAEVNTGTTWLAALPGYKYRITGVRMIAIGGNAGGATTIDLLATQSASSAKIVAAAIAGLTRSAVVRDGDANGAVLADGASYIQNDVNTAISVSKTGASLTTATAIDVILTYEVAV